MAIANPRIHMICGICGSNKDLTYRIKEEADDEIDGKINQVVYIHCSNCSSLTSLDEIINEEK